MIGVQMFPFKNIQEYNQSFSKTNSQELMEEAQVAIAWGEPDPYSSGGMSQAKLVNIISKLVSYINNSSLAQR